MFLWTYINDVSISVKIIFISMRISLSPKYPVFPYFLIFDGISENFPIILEKQKLWQSISWGKPLQKQSRRGVLWNSFLQILKCKDSWIVILAKSLEKFCERNISGWLFPPLGYKCVKYIWLQLLWQLCVVWMGRDEAKNPDT